MATLAEQLVGSVLQSSQNAPDIAGNFAKGAELAQRAEQIQQQRQQLEQKKQEVQMTKLEKVGGWLETYSKMPDGAAKKAFSSQFVTNGIKAMGLEDVIHPDVIKMMTTDPMLAGYLNSKVRAGELSVSELSQPEKIAGYYAKEGKQFGDQEKFKETISDEMPSLLKAEGEYLKNEAAAQRAQKISAPRMGQLEARLTDQAAGAVNKVHNAMKPVIQPALNIQKGMHILEEKNVSWKRINEVAQDFNKALTNSAVASDFKLKQLETPSLKQKIADAFSFATSDPDQPADPKVVAFWKKFGEDLGSIYNQQISALAKNQGKTAATIYKGRNDIAYKAIQEAVNNYTSGDWMNNADATAAAEEDPKVDEYAKANNLSYKQALGILMKRGYKPGGQ